jgi:hypothetical protein
MAKAATLEAARAAKEEAKRRLADVADVVGVGLTKAKSGGYAVKVNLQSAPAEPMPDNVQGVPLVVEVVGTIRKRGP